MNFTVLDFETANSSDASICAAGVAIFEDGRLVESRQWLIRPPRGYGFFWSSFTEVHGLTWFDVRDEPEFPEIWPELFRTLSRTDVVIAHNAAFDMRKLAGILQHFGLPNPGLAYLCSLQLSRRVWPELPSHSLNDLANYIGHVFQHHQAQDDAETAGWVLLAMMRQTQASSPRNLAAVYGLNVQGLALPA